jgi:hypothetical protein
MEQDKDVFRFEDFIDVDKLTKMKSELLKEGVFTDDVEEEDYEEIDLSMNPYSAPIEEEEEEEEVFPTPVTPEEEEEEDEEEGHTYESASDEDDLYKLYKDKAEDFVCDIAIEGVSQSDTEVRLIVESEDWTLMFKGGVKNGKCVIPMKKLSILSEGQKGIIKLEVNADGTLFTPWEDEFVVKASKKVTVKVNESRSSKKPVKSNKPGVSVKVRK